MGRIKSGLSAQKTGIRTPNSRAQDPFPSGIVLTGEGCPLRFKSEREAIDRSSFSSKKEVIPEVPFHSSGRHGSPACPTSYWGAHPGPDRELQGERQTARKRSIGASGFPKKKEGNSKGVQEMSSP